jgi:branched-chain amino acid aminotransferase
MLNIKTIPAETSRLSETDFSRLDFGRTFSDHMLEMVFENGEWQEPVIKPYGPISFTPALNALHYGQAVFEGMKAYYSDENTINLFRPKDHHARLNKSCHRISIPEVPEDVFINGLEQLLKLDSGWVPKTRGHALYLRPFIFSSEEYIASRVSQKYRFYIITSPVAAYYKEGFNPVKLSTPDGFVRAVKGGTGEAKTAGNYAASFLPARKAQSEGFTQVLWLDAKEHTYIEEVGTMNIFFMINGTLITPDLAGSVLDGITRRSVLQVAKDMGVKVDERRIKIDEVFEAHAAGTLDDVFGAGTAAVISPVGLIHHNGKSISIGNGKIGDFAKKMFDTITGIQYGELDDPYGWVHPVKIG